MVHRRSLVPKNIYLAKRFWYIVAFKEGIGAEAVPILFQSKDKLKDYNEKLLKRKNVTATMVDFVEVPLTKLVG